MTSVFARACCAVLSVMCAAGLVVFVDPAHAVGVGGAVASGPAIVAVASSAGSARRG